MPNISPAAWNYDTAAHLLLRAGFGHDGRFRKSAGEANQVSSLAKKTPDDAVAALLRMKTSTARGPAKLGDGNWAKLQGWWLDRMVKNPKAVREKAVLFLHAHFATARAKVDRPYYMAIQNALFREFALGDFRKLVKRINIDPAMLWWLDGISNKKGFPNENYGRELQELFTLGVYDFAGNKNYSQNDVEQAAKILTGWRNREDHAKLSSYFTMSRHEPGSKTIYASDAAETPNQNPTNQYLEPANAMDETLATTEHERLIDAIFNHVDTEGRPTVARYMARKAWKFYAYDPVVDMGTSRADLSLIDDLADAFKNSGYNFGELLRAIFLREEFYADSTKTVKSPVEYVVGTLRMLRGKLKGATRDNYSAGKLADMGQEIFNPPDVFSWRGNDAWITSQTMLKRCEFARDLAQNDTSTKHELGFNIFGFIDIAETTRAGVVDQLLKLLGPLPVDSMTRDELIAWLGTMDPIDLTDTTFVDKNVRALINLILTLPQYHVQ